MKTKAICVNKERKAYSLFCEIPQKNLRFYLCKVLLFIKLKKNSYKVQYLWYCFLLVSFSLYLTLDVFCSLFWSSMPHVINLQFKLKQSIKSISVCVLTSLSVQCFSKIFMVVKNRSFHVQHEKKKKLAFTFLFPPMALMKSVFYVSSVPIFLVF